MPKRAPIAVGNFAKLVNPDNNYLFVDRTPFIKQIVFDADVMAFHTFRRGGKSLLASMLQHFFAAEVTGVPTKGMFDTLAIGREDKAFVDRYQGQYPVIMISFKEVQEATYESAQTKIKAIVMDAYRNHRYLLDSAKIYPEDKEDIRKILADENFTKEKLEHSLFTLTRLLHKHHGKKVWVIIDEYDTPLTAAYRKDYLDSMTLFMKNFLSAGLKDNDYLEKGVLTGIIRFAQESMLSGLNNLKIYTLLTPGDYQPYFAFTEAEVAALFNEVGLSHETESIKQWYNGYQVGGQALYNPWSIMNCIDNKGVLRPYWVNTADDALLKESLLYAPDAAKRLFEKLITAEAPLEAQLSERIRFDNLRTNPYSLWSLLYATGYLTGEIRLTDDHMDYLGALRIPNVEVKGIYKSIFETWLNEVFQGNHVELLNTLRNSDIDAFTEMLGQYLLDYASSNHLKYEGSYHSLVLGIIYGLGDTHHVFSGRLETGLGFSDLLLIPRERTGNKKAILIEFKHTKKNETAEQAVNKAFDQIATLHYDAEVHKYPYITELLKVGMAFEGKAVLCKSEVQRYGADARESAGSARAKRPTSAEDEAGPSTISRSSSHHDKKKVRTDLDTTGDAPEPDSLDTSSPSSP
jgi:hypothetical protein